MKGDKILRILEVVGSAACTSIEIFMTIAETPYGSSFGRLEKEFQKKVRVRERRSAMYEEQAREYQRYHTTLYKLTHDGFIEERERDKKNFFNLTARGIKKLAFLKNQKKEFLPVPAYEKRESGKWVIIVFDIPEQEKRKRAWLRSVLRNLGFTMVQKSVWRGKVKLPKDFLEDIRRLKLSSCIEIFEATKLGTLKNE